MIFLIEILLWLLLSDDCDTESTLPSVTVLILAVETAIIAAVAAAPARTPIPLPPPPPHARNPRG